jgi:hypothetical protein
VSKITSDLLYDTLNVLQLARETAISHGKTAQAERLAPVAEDLRELVASSRRLPSPASSADLMSQPEMRFLLEKTTGCPPSPLSRAAPVDETHGVIQAMSSGGMNDLDIARHVGMTRDEVHLILAMSRSSPPLAQNRLSMEVQK